MSDYPIKENFSNKRSLIFIPLTGMICDNLASSNSIQNNAFGMKQ